MHSGYFRQFTNAENEANDLGPDAEVLSEDERRRRGEERVDNKFDPDHYLFVLTSRQEARLTTHRRADFVNDEEIQELIRWRRPCSPEHHRAHEFSEDEKLIMLRLPRKERRSFSVVCLLSMTCARNQISQQRFKTSLYITRS